MKESKLYKVIVYITLTVFCIIFVFPVFNMVMLSFMSNEELLTSPVPLIPSVFRFENYKGIIDAFGYYGPNGEYSYVWRFLGNTLFLIVSESCAVILSSTLCAYGFSKIKFPGRDVAFGIVLATMMIPGAVLMIPQFILFRDFGWLDTLNPLWIPLWFGGGAMRIFLMRQFMRTLPDTLIEAAKIDGAGHFRSYWHIILPNCKPMIAMQIIGVVSGTWGDFFGPFIYVNSKTKWTVGLAVANMAQSASNNSSYGMGSKSVQMATCVIMSIVPLITFIVNQKNYIENVTITGVKG